MTKAIIFDLDGTLADTMGDLVLAMNEMLRQLGYPERTREELLRCINRGARHFVFGALPEGAFPSIDDEGVTEALRIYGDAYAAHPVVTTAEFPGMTEALRSLKADGWRLGVLSNKQDELVQTVVGTLVPGIFDAVSGQRDLPTKPDPAAALRMAAELGAAPADCVFCGDSDIDMKTAQNAGMYPLGVAWGYRSPELLRASGAAAIVETARGLERAVGSLQTPPDP